MGELVDFLPVTTKHLIDVHNINIENNINIIGSLGVEIDQINLGAGNIKNYIVLDIMDKIRLNPKFPYSIAFMYFF